MQSPKKQRDVSIDTLRGLACIFLVAYHVIGASAHDGLRIESGVVRDLNDLLSYVRMPLFTFLSGFVYAARPFRDNVKKFVSGKFRRLIIPMLTAGTLFALAQMAIDGTNSKTTDWYLLHIYPVGHYWFIEALFIIFLIVIPLEKFHALEKPQSFAAAFFVVAIVYPFIPNTRLLSLGGVVYLFPYFLAGLAISRFSLHEAFRLSHGVAGLGVVIGALGMHYLQTIDIGPKRAYPALAIGIITCICLLSLRMKDRLLAHIGRHSYAIYIYHVFFTAGARIFLTRAGITNDYLLFCASLGLGLAGPMLVKLIAGSLPVLPTLLLGEAPGRSRVSHAS